MVDFYGCKWVESVVCFWSLELHRGKGEIQARRPSMSQLL